MRLPMLRVLCTDRIHCGLSFRHLPWGRVLERPAVEAVGKQEPEALKLCFLVWSGAGGTGGDGVDEEEQPGCPSLLLLEDSTQWLAPMFIPCQGTHGKKV